MSLHPGLLADIDAQAIAPIWPPKPESLLIDNGVYDVRPVPLNSIAMVTDRVLKVRLTHPLLPHLPSNAMSLRSTAMHWCLYGAYLH